MMAPPPPPGCTDTYACNFGSAGPCEYSTCLGCTLSSACNFDPTAVYNDGSCEWLTCAGCLNSTACNYDATATIAASCDFSSCQGCTNPAASNFDPTATQDDGTCILPGCTLSAACNYDGLANTNDGSCTFPALGYDCAGVCYDTNGNTVCDVTEGFLAGCMDPTACNFDASANLTDPASCDYLNLDGLPIVAVGTGASAGATLAPQLSGGTGPYVLVEQPGGGVWPSHLWSQIPPGRYTFSAADSNGCASLNSRSVMLPYVGCE